MAKSPVTVTLDNASGSKMFLRRNDTAPTLDATLKDADDAVVDLTGATVVFTMTDATGAKKVNRQSASLVDASGGKVRYSWVAADTDAAGEFTGEFEVTYADATKQTFPTQGGIGITIVGDLDET